MEIREGKEGRFWIFSDINMEAIIKRNVEYGCQSPIH
jgi:hypothetical protein